MTVDQVVLGGAALCALLALAVAVVLLRSRARARAELAAARAETATLRDQLARVERLLVDLEHRSGTAPEPRERPEFTITELGRDRTDPAPAPIDRALFADLVLRETVVRAASLAHGVRRALGAESRHRIRFEVRREVRRARKQRRADTREAVREWQARQRAAMSDGADVA